MNYFDSLFKDFVILKPGSKVPMPGTSQYGNVLIAKDTTANDLGGILRDDIILIDVDDEEQANRLLNLVKGENLRCVAIKTDRGIHFYFANNNNIPIKSTSHLTSGLGITIDTKNSNGKMAYAVFKRNGVYRQCIYGETYLGDGRPLDYLPKYLFPIKVKEPSKVRPLWELRDGDGRNSYLHQFWKFTLIGNGYDSNDVRTTLLLINKYILGEPLDDREIETIAREEQIYNQGNFIPNPNYNNSNNCNYNLDGEYIGISEDQPRKNKKEKRLEFCYRLALHLINKYNMVRVEALKKDILYYYTDNHYKALVNDNVIDTLITEGALSFGELLSKSEHESVVRYLGTETRRILKVCLERQKELYIATNNKLIVFTAKRDIRIEEPRPLREDGEPLFCTTKINVSYNEDVDTTEVETFLNTIANNNKGTAQLIKEMVGYCLYPRNIFRKSFFLIGNGGNGKSTFLNFLIRFLGSDNTSNISLYDLENNRFSTANLLDKLINTGDDINSDDFQKLSSFKTITSGDAISAEFKGGQAFTFNPFCKLIYSANIAPALRENSEGIKSRVIYIPFNHNFIQNGKIEKLDYLQTLITTKNLQALLIIALRALKTLFERGKFNNSKEAQQLTEENIREADPVYSFLIDFEMQGNLIYEQKISRVYYKFIQFCKYNNIKVVMTQYKFSQAVRGLYPNLTTKQIWQGNSYVRIFSATTDEVIYLSEDFKENTEGEEEEIVKNDESVENNTEIQFDNENEIKWDHNSNIMEIKEFNSYSGKEETRFVIKITDKDVYKIFDSEFTERFFEKTKGDEFELRQDYGRITLKVPFQGIDYSFTYDSIKGYSVEQVKEVILLGFEKTGTSLPILIFNNLKT